MEGLILVACTCCKHTEVVSEDVFWLKLEVLCVKCFKYFIIKDNYSPIFISRLYNPNQNSN